MTLKSLLVVGALTFSAIGIANAKSYYFTLTTPAMAGATELKAGEYEVKVSGTDAIFTNEGGKSFKVPVTVGQSDKKFDGTSVDATNKDGMDSIREIDLGGSNTKLQFTK